MSALVPLRGQKRARVAHCERRSVQEELRFDGPDLTPADTERLGRQLLLVRGVMGDGQWRTLARLAELVGAPEASVSARLRDLRKPRFGGFQVQRQRVTPGSGLYVYRLVVVEQVEAVAEREASHA